VATGILGALENTSDGEPMNEEKDQKPEGHEQDYSDFAKHQRPRSEDKGGGGGTFMRGCGILVGVVALAFFFILGTCFLG
jgi:hypothetical protein